MKVLFLGLGSIGKRHVRLLLKNFDHEVSALRSRKGQGTDIQIGVKELVSWNEVDSTKYDVAFVTNPTSLHLRSALECAQRGMHLFIEKPIDCRMDDLDTLLDLVEVKKLTTYVAYPLRFHPIIKELKRLLEKERPLHSRIISSSYLPDWRPHQNHLESYSAYRHMGGGVILDLSHELDYASYLFGDVVSINGKYGKLGEVTVDSEDYADIIITHESSVCTNIHLSYLGRVSQRIIEVDTHDSHIEADLINGTISYSGVNGCWKNIFAIDRDEMYLEQLKYFFENITNRQMTNNLPEAGKLFGKIIEFRESM